MEEGRKEDEEGLDQSQWLKVNCLSGLLACLLSKRRSGTHKAMLLESDGRRHPGKSVLEETTVGRNKGDLARSSLNSREASKHALETSNLRKGARDVRERARERKNERKKERERERLMWMK